MGLEGLLGAVGSSNADDAGIFGIDSTVEPSFEEVVLTVSFVVVAVHPSYCSS